MSKLDRRSFLKTSALGLAAASSPAVLSHGIDNWRDFRRNPTAARFQHGVASGDPLSDAVIIWTRVTIPETKPHPRFKHFFKKHKKVFVGWEVATDPGFRHLVRRGGALVTDATDYTLKVDVIGLRADETYYYRFRTAGNRSPVGKTKTLPLSNASQVKLAVMSCSNYPAGYFNVYTEASRTPDLDAVVHLGDYLYEYGEGGYASANADAIGRSFRADNNSELLTLTDYRKRYNQYRTDHGLQALHAAAPFICVWDDHEVANDTWREGAENHNPGEGGFETRKAQALQAYFEWLPIRPAASQPREVIYRNFRFGELVNLMMLDTRLIGRDQQLDYANYIASDGSFNATQFSADISDPNRTLLGHEQLGWLQATMASSAATWQVLGQQVLMGRMNLPAELLLNLSDTSAVLTAFSELATIKGRILAGDPSVTAIERARVETVMPYNLDAWDGYAAERETVLGTALATGKNLVTLAGDTHNGWASNLRDYQGNIVGVELATSSVTSPGFEEYLQLPQPLWPTTEAGFQLMIDDLQYVNLGDRGYLTVTFTEEETIAEWHYISNILSTEYHLLTGRSKTLKVTAGNNQLEAG